jgi:hypothetical protein
MPKTPHIRLRPPPWTPAGLVVERDVAGDDGDAELVRGSRDAVDRLRELPADLRSLGIAEVEAIGERERLAAGFHHLPRRLHGRLITRAKRIVAPEWGAVERYGDPADAVDAQHGSTGPRPPHRPRADELVVLLIHPRLRLAVDRVGLPVPDAARLLPDLVTWAVVGEVACRDRADDVAAEERTQLTVLGHLADRRARKLPARAHFAHFVEPLGRDHRDHSLLRLRDHDLPRLEVALAERYAVEMHIDADLAGHLGERRREAGGAAILE